MKLFKATMGDDPKGAYVIADSIWMAMSKLQASVIGDDAFDIIEMPIFGTNTGSETIWQNPEPGARCMQVAYTPKEESDE